MHVGAACFVTLLLTRACVTRRSGLLPNQHDATSTYNAVMDTFWAWRLQQWPEFASSVGVHDFDSRLQRYTVEAFDQRRRWCQLFWRRIDRTNTSSFSPRQNVNLRILQGDIATYIAGYKWRFFGGLNPVNIVESVSTDVNFWLDAMQFEDESAYQQYNIRLTALASQINEQIHLMREAVRMGFTGHRVSVEAVVSDITNLLGRRVTSLPFYKPFNTSLSLVKASTRRKEMIRRQGVSVVRDQVVPAYRRLRHFLKREYIVKARQRAGVGALAGGLAYYHACLKWHLSYAVTAGQLLQMALGSIQSIQARMRRIQAMVGFDGTLREFLKFALGANKFFYRTEEELLQGYRDILQRRIVPRLSSIVEHAYFPQLKVQPMTFDGPSAAVVVGTHDDAMADVFFVNVRNPLIRPKWKMLYTALHEALPGRYLQVLSQINASVPNFRKFRDFRKLHSVPYHLPTHSAYTQGWALYAGCLGHEMGLFHNGYEELGCRCAELESACHMAVDVGIHAFGWSRQRAISYISAQTGVPTRQAAADVNRIITLPGHATGPQFTNLKIRQLRDRAKRRLGAGFDVREFHDQVLRLGPVPLITLQRTLDAWILRRAPSSGAPPSSGYQWALVPTAVIAWLSLH